jgi:hypothetical protein
MLGCAPECSACPGSFRAVSGEDERKEGEEAAERTTDDFYVGPPRENGPAGGLFTVAITSITSIGPGRKSRESGICSLRHFRCQLTLVAIRHHRPAECHDSLLEEAGEAHN